MNILVLGPQGSGKGTQAKRISAACGIPHVSTGDMLRAAIAAGSGLGLQVKAVIDSGELVSDELTLELVRERLAQTDAKGGFVLDGYPRNLSQAADLDALLGERKLGAVLFFDLDDATATERMLARAEAEGRADDTPEVIARRLELYHEQTAPVVQHYQDAGVLVRLAAERTVEEVWAQIDAALTRVDS